MRNSQMVPIIFHDIDITVSRVTVEHLLSHTQSCVLLRAAGGFLSACVSQWAPPLPARDHPTHLNPHYHFSTPSSWIYFCLFLLLSHVSVHPVPLLLLLSATICHLCVTCGAPPACPQHPSLSIFTLVPLLYRLFFFASYLVLSIFHFLIFLSFFVVSLTFSSCIWPF